MQTINIIAVGSLKEKYFVDAQNEYIKRLQAFCRLDVKECKPHVGDIAHRVRLESEELAKKIPQGKTVLLDIQGTFVSSVDIATIIESSTNISSTLSFVIGGSDGVSDELKYRIDTHISLGRITLPHQLCRIVLLEQVYRGYMITNGRSYHK